MSTIASKMLDRKKVIEFRRTEIGLKRSQKFLNKIIYFLIHKPINLLIVFTEKNKSVSNERDDL